jgi:hypothetical protein
MTTRLKPRVKLHYTCGVMYAIIERGTETRMVPLYWQINQGGTR